MKTIIFALTAFALYMVTPVMAADNEVPREDWVSQMSDLLPAALCQDGSWFRSCFTSSAAQCHDTATTATASCLRQYEKQIPATLVQPRDGTKWGQKVGECAGTLFEQQRKNQRVNSEACNDVTRWR